MDFRLAIISCILTLCVFLCVFNEISLQNPLKPQIIFTKNSLYHGVYPGGFTGEEDDFSELDVESYERFVEKKVAWVYFSHNWYKSKIFPQEMVRWISQRGSVPFIRLMLRCAPDRGSTEDTFTLKNINSGLFDEDFHLWFRAARMFRKPLFVEYGIEVNGDWFPWNGQWNGEERGPENFRNAYRRIIDISRRENANNILWSFHVDDDDSPNVDWNKFENYYPGDDYIDFFTVSIYGMLTPQDTQIRNFDKQMSMIYPRLFRLSPIKKIVVIEFGTTKNNTHVNQENWADSALNTLLSFQYENVVGFSWWNEAWHNKRGKSTTMRVQDNKKLADVFRKTLKQKNILDSVSFVLEE